MMECLEFRRQAGADPQHLGPEARQHAATCQGCTGHLAALLALDERIVAALRVQVPVATAAPRSGGAAIASLDRRRWMALAASIIGGVLVGTLLWVGGPRSSLAQDLVGHLGHEPEALVATKQPEEDIVLGRVLERGGIRLRPDAPLVSYARSCRFRGHTAPHLVVQTTAGPVTVMVLRNEKPASPVNFDEQGFAGWIVPTGPGSIAVIGSDGADLEEIAARVLAAVEWLDD
jgi:hypothetical protein